MRPRDLTIVGLLCALTFLVGCTSDSTGPTPLPSFVGTWAGVAWQGDAGVSYGEHGDTMFIWGLNPVGSGAMASSTVEIRVRYAGTGTYILGPSDGTVTHLIGGDGVVSRHGTFDENSGAVTLVRSNDGRISGVVYFNARDVRDSSPNPPLLRFEGSFQVDP